MILLMKLTGKACFNPEEALKVLERLMEHQPHRGIYSMTHPPTEVRLERLLIAMPEVVTALFASY